MEAICSGVYLVKLPLVILLLWRQFGGRKCDLRPRFLLYAQHNYFSYFLCLKISVHIKLKTCFFLNLKYYILFFVIYYLNIYIFFLSYFCDLCRRPPGRTNQPHQFEEQNIIDISIAVKFAKVQSLLFKIFSTNFDRFELVELPEVGADGYFCVHLLLKWKSVPGYS